ncbi:TIGR02594 family protein [Lysobacter enzymogenes]|uniref:TIGR02594 family protein n=1 Tax=Lysobacter enzymogenes TaxID=69 RepID=UPI003749F064
MTKFVKAVFHKDIRTIEFTADNGDRMLRSGGTLAWLFNNPGNLRPKKKGLYTGQIGYGDTRYGKLCIFTSVAAGHAEKRALLRRKYNPMTLRKAIYTYAPPEDKNDSEAYLSYVKKKTGFADDVVLKDLSDSQLDSMMDAMEQMEGFNAEKKSRKEKWVHVTDVTLSDGARPLPHQPVVVKRGDKTSEVKTDAFGRLPAFITFNPGEQVSLLFRRSGQALESIADFVLQPKSRSLTLVRSAEEHRSSLANHNPQLGNKAHKPEAIRYVIQPGDTLGKIAKRFKTDAGKIAADNKSAIRNPNRIFPGQTIWIHGKGPASGGGSAGTATAAAKKKPKPVSPPASGGAQGASKMSGAKLAERDDDGWWPDWLDFGVPKLSLPKPSPAGGTGKSTRSKENRGHPLAIVPIDSKRAPWMVTAISELKRWAGKSEGEIEEGINYHKESGASSTWSMRNKVGEPWCASFVNYCLKSAGYQKSKGTASSQSFRDETGLFYGIDTPVYGCIAVWRKVTVKTVKNKEGKLVKKTSVQGHTAFVYGKDSTGETILVGGNQDDKISFMMKSGTTKKFMGYFVPMAYKQFALNEIKGGAKLDVFDSAYQLNVEFGIPVGKDKKAKVKDR